MSYAVILLVCIAVAYFIGWIQGSDVGFIKGYDSADKWWKSVNETVEKNKPKNK